MTGQRQCPVSWRLQLGEPSRLLLSHQSRTSRRYHKAPQSARLWPELIRRSLKMAGLCNSTVITTLTVYLIDFLWLFCRCANFLAYLGCSEPRLESNSWAATAWRRRSSQLPWLVRKVSRVESGEPSPSLPGGCNKIHPIVSKLTDLNHGSSQEPRIRPFRSRILYELEKLIGTWPLATMVNRNYRVLWSN